MMPKRHYVGATYDLTQENMNWLIQQLEEARERCSKQHAYAERLERLLVATTRQLDKAEEFIREEASWSLDRSDLYQMDIDDHGGSIDAAREYFYAKIAKNA